MLRTAKKQKKNPPGKKKELGKNERVVRALCPLIDPDDIPDEEQPPDIETRMIFQCPNGNNCKAIHKPVWRRVWKRKAESGFTNPYDHLVRCYGSVEALTAAYETKVGATSAGGASSGRMESFLSPKRPPVSPTAQDCYEWILLIVLKDVPVTAVEDDTYRRFGKPKTLFSYKRLMNVIRIVTELVEEAITDDIRKCREMGGKAAIVHDGWSTSQNEHYVGLFLSFCIPTKGLKNGMPHIFWTPICVLLACSPMNHHTYGDDDSQAVIDAAIRFNATQHIEFIEHVLDYFKVSLAVVDGVLFVVCQITDNASVMKSIADLLAFPGVGCNNHKFNLDIEDFVDDNCKNLIESVRKTMVSIKTSSILKQRMKTKRDLQPIFYNDTRWYGKYLMLDRWLELRDYALEVNAELDRENYKKKCRIKINGSPEFLNRVKKYTRYFESFHKIHCAMQTQLITLRESRQNLKALLAVLDADKTEDNPLFGCNMEPTRIQDDASIVHSPDFETGVVKIQAGMQHTLTDAEKVAVRDLRKSDVQAEDQAVDADAGAVQIDPGSQSPSTVARLQEQKQMIAREAADEYVDCSFILGSVAIVERLWSLSGHILTSERTRLLPINLESLLFLKVNRRYWDEHTVQKAMDILKTRERAARAAAKAAPVAARANSDDESD